MDIHEKILEAIKLQSVLIATIQGIEDMRTLPNGPEVQSLIGEGLQKKKEILKDISEL